MRVFGFWKLYLSDNGFLILFLKFQLVLERIGFWLVVSEVSESVKRVCGRVSSNIGDM